MHKVILIWVLQTQYIPEDDPPDDSSSYFKGSEPEAVPETSSDGEIEYPMPVFECLKPKVRKHITS